VHSVSLRPLCCVFFRAGTQHREYGDSERTEKKRLGVMHAEDAVLDWRL
jgi:hypothetical protein